MDHTTQEHMTESRWLVPGQDMPTSSAARFSHTVPAETEPPEPAGQVTEPAGQASGSSQKKHTAEAAPSPRKSQPVPAAPDAGSSRQKHTAEAVSAPRKSPQVPPAPVSDKKQRDTGTTSDTDIGRSPQARPGVATHVAPSRRRAAQAATAVSDQRLSDKKTDKKKKKLTRKEFAKTHVPRMHKTGPQPKLAPYQADIRKLLKKGYAAADIYHWLHDMRGEDVSQRSVQRFVRTLRQMSGKS